MIKALLLDFDGTLTDTDMLSLVCGMVGKAEESEVLNQNFLSGKSSGVDALVTRINFLQGVKVSDLHKFLATKEHLNPGAKELLNFSKSQGIMSVIYSGNMRPLLEYYQKLLGVDYLVSSNPKVEDGIIQSISRGDFSDPDFKLTGVKKILAEHNIEWDSVVAVGDSLADKSVMELAKVAVAINPKYDAEKFADFTVTDLAEVIGIIKNH